MQRERDVGSVGERKLRPPSYVCLDLVGAVARAQSRHRLGRKYIHQMAHLHPTRKES